MLKRQTTSHLIFDTECEINGETFLSPVKDITADIMKISVFYRNVHMSGKVDKIKN